MDLEAQGTMSDSNKDSHTKTRLLEENEQLQRRLEEAEQALEAIRSGAVDALVVAGPQGAQVFSISGAEHVYRVIVETMNEAALTVDSEGTILFCNQRFCDLMKTTIPGTMGHKITAFIARPQQRSLGMLLADAHLGPVQRHLLLRAGDGTPVPVQLSASPLQVGESLSLCLVATDLTELETSAHSIRVLREHEQAMQEATERLQAQSEELRSQADELRTQTEELTAAEATLRASEERYRAFFESSLDAILITTPEGDIEAANAAACRMFGRAEDELIQGGRCGVVDASDPRVAIALEERTRTGRFRGELNFKRKDGTVFPVEESNVVFTDRNGKLKTVMILRDITERKQAEEALQELAATLESKVAQRTAQLQQRARQLAKLTLEISETEDRERQRLAEILHDDLQQQLAAAKFQVSLLRGRAKYDASLQAAIVEIDHMLKDAIEKSRSLSHELSPVVMHHSDLGETFRWLADQMQAKHGLAVSVEARGEIRSESEALKSFLYKAAREFLFNVAKHARVEEARIRVRRFGRCLHLSVSDRGRGFDPQGLREAAGFGLLNIRERVELLGGRMKIKSAAGKGSTFSIVVPDSPESEGVVGAGPRAYPTSATAGHRDGKEGSHGGPPLRVLVADDHEIVRHGLVSLLSEEDTVEIVGEAANGREAVDLADRLHPDVVIMDVSMPVLSGAEATRRIKEDLPQTRVVTLSMWEEPEVRERMYQAGAESYVLKTAPSEELLAAIRGQDARGT
jgi:PAS domain S-box-containing protein